MLYSSKLVIDLFNFYKQTLMYKRTFTFQKFGIVCDSVLRRLTRLQWQVKYFLNNWIFSTNHKRISINYFWFVLLAGVVGLLLATVIRIEMAYPGVGILAGDNSQYLSIVTAHGVIMVFFMAMPLLFGFFTNFLLPTQLGVHDVAFPRMNSASFWFIPASILVLAQLVCVDRRYQRMNCFNVRELQSLVRKKFFFDLVNSNDYRLGIDKSLIGLRYKLNDDLTQHTGSLFTNYGIQTNSTRKFSFDESASADINASVATNASLLLPNKTLSTQLEAIKSSFLESFDSKRYLQSDSPSLVYKIKIGNYLPEKPFYTSYGHILNTLNARTISTRKANWFLLDTTESALLSNYESIRDAISLSTSSSDLTSFLFKKEGVYTSHLDIFNFFNALSHSLDFTFFLNKRWVSYNYLDQKFVNLFFVQNKQTLVLNNWKNLKLQREGWRCRMLLARNQNSMYRRYIDENEIIWVVEKNAKDLLPGWAMITPFSSKTRYTLIGKTDIGILVVMITLMASLVSCSNFLITYRYLSTLNNRKMRDARSFFTEAIIATSWMTIGANPMLFLALFLLISDRHWKTAFFDYSGGGDTVMFQHMFWFFGHPEVYIIMVPCFGLSNVMLSFYTRKRISARASLMYSMYAIAFLGFFVWGHHMYMVGLSHTTRMLYSTLTVMISIPSATKVMHWMVTFINSSIHFELPLFFVMAFVFFFLSGGISGMSNAHTGMNVVFHDTLFLIGHFHVMLAGALMFASFGAIYFYLPSIFGVRYNRFFAYLHTVYYILGQILTIVPMIWLGYAGMPRRVLDFPAAFGGWNSLSTSAHMLSLFGVLCFMIAIFDSMRKKRAYTVKTFGIGRYNTRLNFYLYEISRSKYWLYKSTTLLPSTNVKLQGSGYSKVENLENTDTTLVFYYLKK